VRAEFIKDAERAANSSRVAGARVLVQGGRRARGPGRVSRRCSAREFVQGARRRVGARARRARRPV